MKYLSTRQTGVAMVVVLWMVSLLTIMAASFSLSTQRNTALVKNAQDRARGLALADAGVHYAMLMLSLPDPMRRWRSDGLQYKATLPSGEVSLVILDESGKVDINAASEQTWRALLGKLVGGDEIAASLTDKIMDWRDNDDLKRLNGAEAKDYKAEGKAYVPQNKNFQTLEELQMVLGITPALYKRLEPLLTLYSGQDGINPIKASSEALRLLLGLDEKAVQAYLTQRWTNPPNSPPPPLIPTAGAVPIVSGGDIAYTIYARSRTEEGLDVGLRAIVKRQFSRNTGAPFAFAGWKQQIIGANPKSDPTPAFPR